MGGLPAQPLTGVFRELFSANEASRESGPIDVLGSDLSLDHS